jgi:hypothetical protein
MLNTPCIGQINFCAISDFSFSFFFFFFLDYFFFYVHPKKSFIGTQLDVNFLINRVCVQTFNCTIKFPYENDYISHVCLDYYDTNDKTPFNLFSFLRNKSEECVFLFTGYQKVNKKCTLKRSLCGWDRMHDRHSNTSKA